MADLSGLAAFGGAVYPGVVQGQTNQAVAQQQQEAAKQAQMRTQQIASDVASDVSYANSLAALSTIFNTPPGNPPPQGAGQPSQPSQPAPQPPPQGAPPQAMPPQGAAPGVVPPVPPGQTQPMPATATGQPVAPPGGQFGASAPGGPVAGSPPQAQPQRPPMPPQAAPPAPRPQGAPQAPPPQGAQQPNPQQIVAAAKQKAAQAEQQTAQVTAPAQGQMSMQQLVALVNKANPGLLQKNPSAFAKTVERMQKFLSEDGKTELAQQKMSMEYDAKIQKIQADADAKARTAENQVAVANIRAEAAKQVADIAMAKATAVANVGATSRETVADTNVAGRKDVQVGKDQAAGERADKANTSREKVAAAKNLESLKTAASKLGITPDKDDTAATLQNKIATSAAAKDTLSPDMAKFYAGALLKGDNATVSQILGFSKNRPEMMKQIIAAAQQIDPTFTGQKAAAAVAQFGGTKAAASTVGRIVGGTAQGAAEVSKFAPLVESAAKKVDLGKYPTLNRIELAAKEQGGDPNVVQLNSYIQSAKNAYQQIMLRGGRSAKYAQERIDDLLKPNFNMQQIQAGLSAMSLEAAAVKSAAGEAMQDVTGGGTGAPAAGGEGVDTSNPLLK